MTVPFERLQVTTPDGRAIDALAAGSGDHLVVFHDGTPTAAIEDQPTWEAAAASGLRVVSWSRPGYAGSTAQPGRSVADIAADAAAVLAAAGAADQDYVVVGWSGGGPHALAHAALDPRCKAAATIGGIAPLAPFGMAAWLDGMGSDNHTELTAIAAGEPRATAYLAELAAGGFAVVTADQIIGAFGDVIDAVDVAEINRPGVAEHFATVTRAAVSTGISGWRDDDTAFLNDWGFDLATIGVPVSLWQGAHDRMVPVTHAALMASLIPTARLHFDPAEGHLSWGRRLGDIFTHLVAAAGW